jgi:hypothetical protein
MVDRTRATVIARRAADGTPRTQTQAHPPTTPHEEVAMVRISARIPAGGRDALRRLAAAHGLSVAALIDLLSTAAAEQDPTLTAVVADRAEDHRRAWGGQR